MDIPGYDAWKLASPDDDRDDFEDDYCPNCGGEGVVYCCQDEIGCVDPESGCDLCERRCDWCQGKPRKSQPDPDYQRDLRNEDREFFADWPEDN
ncbi:MAG: hypothetical protein E5X86_19620 [Mesorhizobium sp.]|uniref:hypothetical protein n=1 Tax=Mesorhizobium sp. TaxID=1871066 RepID=UPI00122BEE81|nr:hypothetical protein [Mesorhizobium sp.]TIO15582.1 MAG: hypothetical protein E5X86_19620 [Mesorhizobium sp.]